jgi:hypothetical protein
MIKKVSGGYRVLSEKTGKNLGGPYKTKKEAEKRLKQVEFFKHKKGGEGRLAIGDCPIILAFSSRRDGR